MKKNSIKRILLIILSSLISGTLLYFIISDNTLLIRVLAVIGLLIESIAFWPVWFGSSYFDSELYGYKAKDERESLILLEAAKTAWQTERVVMGIIGIAVIMKYHGQILHNPTSLTVLVTIGAATLSGMIAFWWKTRGKIEQEKK